MNNAKWKELVLYDVSQRRHLFWDSNYTGVRQRHGEILTFEFSGEGLSKYFSNTAKRLPREASLQFLFYLNVLTVTLFSPFFRLSEGDHCVQKF
jgi:hypothetical protein